MSLQNDFYVKFPIKLSHVTFEIKFNSKTYYDMISSFSSEVAVFVSIMSRVNVSWCPTRCVWNSDTKVSNGVCVCVDTNVPDACGYYTVCIYVEPSHI
jgi:hypothetical protein